MFSTQVRHYFQLATGYQAQLQASHAAEIGERDLGHYFSLKLQLAPDQTVQALSFDCPRCVPAIACGAYLHAALVGHPAGRAAELTTETLLRTLGGLPTERLFYAWMAIQAVQQALKGDA